MNMTINPFTDEHLSAAATLLSARHRRNRRVLPQLPARFEDPAVAQASLQHAWQKPWTSGTVALYGDELVGYLIGSATFDQHMGRTAWIRQAGYALAADVDIEVIRDLYAAAGPRWLALGCFEHYAMITTAERLMLDAWYSLDFGQQHAYGLCDLSAINDKRTVAPDSVTVRRANKDDKAYLADLSFITAEHLFYAPTWAPTPPEVAAGRPESYGSVAEDEEATTWLAFRREGKDEEVLGFQIYYAAEPEDDELFVPDNCVELSAAGVKANARGQGIGRALINAGFAHAQKAGYKYCLTDWRTTNLPASRFFPHRGFEPIVFRLHRCVDQRITWANHVPDHLN